MCPYDTDALHPVNRNSHTIQLMMMNLHTKFFNHSNQWLTEKKMYGWTAVKINATEAYWRGHKIISKIPLVFISLSIFCIS